MPNLTSVHVTGGIPDAGTGTVSTIDELILVGLPLTGGTTTVSGTMTAIVSGTTFISGGTVTSVVSGTTFVSGGTVTAVVSGTATATLNQGGSALSSTNGIYANLLFNNALVSASVGLPVNLVTYAPLTAVISGTTFISGGTVTAQISGGTSFISGGNITAVVSGTVTAVLNIAGAAVGSTNGEFTNLLQNNGTLTPTNGLWANVMFNNAIVSASVGLPVNIVSGALTLSSISNTTFFALQTGSWNNAVIQGGVALSSTNGIYTNLLQQNATLTNTNGIFANMLLGNAAISSTNPVFVGGETASGVADANNPVKIGGLAKSAQPTSVADGQRVNGLFDLLGKQVVVHSVRGLKANVFTTISTTGEVALIPAVNATTFNDVYGGICSNNSGSTIQLTFKDSVAGNTQFVLQVPSFDTRGFMMPESAAYKQTTQNNTWTVTPSLATSISISMLYVKNATS